jgi:EcsC protein family
MKIVAARSLRDHRRGPRGPAQCRQVARTSEPRRPAYKHRRQACRTDRLRVAFFRFQGDRVRDLERARNGAQSRVAYASNSPRTGSQFLHRALATASGAAGGTFGLAALPVELPVSTVIMLRSIADIARSEGEDLSNPEAAISCVEVFALGGRSGSADASESGYFAVRGILAKTVTEAARFVAERGVITEGAPILLKFVTQVAARFGLVVTQKVAAQALPVVGALGGAAVNYAFIDHFQDVARGHFTVRRLERLYGKERIRSEYDLIAAQL